AKIAEREAVQMPAVRGIAKRAEVGIMRSRQVHSSAGHNHAMKLFHRADHVRYVLDHMNRAQLAKRTVAKRVRKPVEVAQHVGAGVRVAIHADRAGIFVDAAPDIENALRESAFSGAHTASFRHSSSVSI